MHYTPCWTPGPLPVRHGRRLTAWTADGHGLEIWMPRGTATITVPALPTGATPDKVFGGGAVAGKVQWGQVEPGGMGSHSESRAFTITP